jgi:exodeoxyribonuclease VII large subunit
MTDQSLSVSEVLKRAQQAIVVEFPGPIWVRGEVTGMRRTNRGAVFCRLADPDVPATSLDIAARGRVMMEVDRALDEAGLGSLRDGVAVRVKGTVGVDARSSVLRLSLLEVDPSFTAGRLAMDRADLLRRMRADGSLVANRLLPLPLVPLEIGLVTRRGSAAHADFIDQLRRSGYRFRVRTAHTSVQGESAADSIALAMRRITEEPIDIVALVRGGGSALDLSVFDSEAVARALAKSPVPVITGIGHEVDRTVADDAAAVAEKTPSAAGEWLVARVGDYAGRIDIARHSIRSEATSALRRHRQLLRNAMADIGGSKATLRRQHDILDRLRSEISHASRATLERRQTVLESLEEWFSAIDVDNTLRRGFAIVTSLDGSTVIRSVGQVSPGDLLEVRLGDGTVRVVVDEQ